MQGQRKSQNFIQKAAVLYLIIWTISPPLEIDMIYRLLALGCAGLWFLVALGRNYLIEKVHIYAAIYTFAVIAIAYIEKWSLDGVLQHIAIYILVVCFFINAFYKEGRWHELAGIVPIILVLLIVFNWRTAQVLLEDPTIARKLVRADEEVYVYLRQGVGGYSLIYPQVCIFPAIWVWITRAFRSNHKFYFAIGCVWLYTYVLCVANSGYSIAIFTSILGIVMFYFYRGRNIWTAVVLAAILFVATLCSILYLDEFREFLLQMFDGTAVAKKITDLVESAQAGAAEGSIYDRLVAYRNSINVILEYPIMGGLWMRSGGGHSAILDQFAKYGLLGGVMYTIIIFCVPNEYKRRYHHPLIHSLSNAVMVAILFVAVLDSFTYSFMAMILVVLPLLYEDIMKWEGIEQ